MIISKLDIPSLRDALIYALRDYTGVELGRIAGYVDGSAVSRMARGAGDMSLERFHRLAFTLSQKRNDHRLADAFSGHDFRNQRVVDDPNGRRDPEKNFLEILEAGGNLRSLFQAAPTYVLLELIDRMRRALFDLEAEVRERDRAAA